MGTGEVGRWEKRLLVTKSMLSFSKGASEETEQHQTANTVNYWTVKANYSLELLRNFTGREGETLAI